MIQRRQRATYLALFMILALVLSACAAPAAPATDSGEAAPSEDATAGEPEGEKQIIYALYQEPELLNPFIATQTAAAETYQFVIEGLLGVNPDGDRFPVLAAEVPSVENGLVSEDGLTVTLGSVTGTALWIIVLASPDLPEVDWVNLPVIVYWCVAYTAIFATAGTFFLVQFASMRLPASKVLSYGYLTPVVIILIEGLLGHGWVVASVAAGALVTAAALLVMAVAPDH